MHTGRMTEEDPRNSPRLHLLFAIVFTAVSAVMFVAVLVRPALLGHAGEGAQPSVLAIPRAVIPLIGVGVGLAGVAYARRARKRLEAARPDVP